MYEKKCTKAYFHLPGLFEFFELYKYLFELYENHREYFYDWCEIGSIYGNPSNCIWSGGRLVSNSYNIIQVHQLLLKHSIPARLTFSNLFIRHEHLNDSYCNNICSIFNDNKIQNGIIISSDILLNYLKDNYSNYYYISSTTKTLTNYNDLYNELEKEDYKYVVPDFRFNKDFEFLNNLEQKYKDKTEFLCNECCWIKCSERRKCYENVSLKILGESHDDFICKSPNSSDGYIFSKAMKNPSFISVDDIINVYLPLGFSNFKIEGRGLGSALVLEILLYYLIKPEFQLNVREYIYLDYMLDLF